jgi:hypothetical protein
MRITTILFFFSYLIATAAESVKLPDLRPDFSFPTQQAIYAWATNAFGGTDIAVYKHDDKQVMVVWRMFTSGVTTSDLSFFVQGKDRWWLALWYPMRQEALRSKQRSGGIEIQYYDEQRKEWVERFFIKYEALLNLRA